MNKKVIVLWIVRVALGGFFVWSGAIKIKDLSAFTQTVANYQMLDRPWDAFVAYFVPWLEVVIGIALISGIFARGGLVILLTMLLGFSGAIAWVWNQGLNINCGCYGASDEPTNYPVHLAINGTLILLTAILLWQGRERRASDVNLAF